MVPLTSHFPMAPSAILIRIPEAELLSAAPVIPPVLDLCCGDGYFASLIRPTGFEAGCDFSVSALEQAARRGLHQQLVCNDVTQGLSFPDNSFNTIISNSSLEHVKDIDTTLREIHRILKPGGKLYTTFASSFAYDWWVGSAESQRQYWGWQPVYNYFTLDQWSEHFKAAGLPLTEHTYYLPKRVTQIAMWLDYQFSQVYLTSNKTPARRAIAAMHRIPKSNWIWTHLWRIAFSGFRILTHDQPGGGVLIVAEKP